MRCNLALPIWFALALALSSRGAEPPAASQTADTARQLREYRDSAMGREGSVARGRELFFAESRTACGNCHSVDGSSSKAGPDLFAIGDKFPRRDLIRGGLEPSAEIAVGYGTTIVETKSGQADLGILKEVTAEALELMGADGKRGRIATSDI